MMDDTFGFTVEESSCRHKASEKINKVYEAMEAFDKKLAASGNSFGNMTAEAMRLCDTTKVELILSTQVANGLGTNATVRIFGMNKGQEEVTGHKNGSRLDVRQMVTDDQGCLSIELPKYRLEGFESGKVCAVPIDCYLIEVSKGPAYAIEKMWVDLEGTSPIEKKVTLTQLINPKELGWHQGDFHHHSVYSSPLHGGTDDVCESPKQVRQSMEGVGLSYGALSDHHNILNHKKWLAEGNQDFLPIASKEISTSNGHVMSMNVMEDVIYNIPKDEDRTDDVLYQEFARITEQIISQGGMAQINHPMDLQAAISLSEAMKPHIAMFQTMEIWNGSVPMMQGTTNHLAYDYWLDLLRNGIYIPATAGSDTHNTRADDYHEMVSRITWLKWHYEHQSCEEANDDGLLKEIFGVAERQLSPFIHWAQRSLGTGCVQTIVQCGREKTVESVLEGLKKGNSFMTNGPILFMNIEGCSYGEKVEVPVDGTLSVVCKIIGNRLLGTLELIGSQGIIAEVDLGDYRTGIVHELVVRLPKETLQSQQWLIARVIKDHTNMAVTNPIFLDYV